MEAIAIKLAHHLGNALFHAAVHVAGHETYHHVKHKYFGERCLKNHDVSRALNESFIAALEMIEKQHSREEPDERLRDQGRQAVARLRPLAARYFPAEGAPAVSDASAAILLGDPSSATGFWNELLRQADPMPSSMRKLMEGSFLDAFTYAFKEIGLKRNEKVRAVIVHELLTDLRTSSRSANRKLDVLQRDVSKLVAAMDGADGVRKFHERFHASIDDALKGITTQVAALVDGHKKIERMVASLASHREGAGKARAYVVVYDGAGAALARHPVGDATVSIGRSRSNTIQLSDALVSSRHAEIFPDGDRLLLRDLGSSNGTFVGGDPQRVRDAVLTPPQRLSIGPFTIEVLGPDAGQVAFLPRTLRVTPRRRRRH